MHVILRTSYQMERHLATSATNVTITDAREAAATIAPIAPSSTTRLPPIKLKPFSGDTETWAPFWAKFQQSINNDPSLTTINKHIFLRGYLMGERKHLVEGIAVVTETFEETKKILEAHYSDKNRIIQAHLDCPEDTKPIKYTTPEALNSAHPDALRSQRRRTAYLLRNYSAFFQMTYVAIESFMLSRKAFQKGTFSN